MNKLTKAKFPSSIGVFSPTGHVVMVFATDEGAEKARSALVSYGFSESEIAQFTKDDVLAEFERSEEQAANPLQLGQDVTKVETYLALAKEGCGFLVVHAPKDDLAKQAVAVVQPFGLRFAEKYNRLTLQEIA